MITFKAQFIKTANIKRKGIDSKYHDYQANIVELNTNSNADYITLNKTNCEWGNCKTILHDIAKIFNFLHLKERESQQERFFALTKQTENFENLDENKILGVLQTKRQKDNTLEIENFQVSPDTNYDAIFRKYKHTGKALLESIKEIFEKDNKIVLEAEKSAIPFYEKYGFIKTGVKNKMIFRR